MAIAIHALAYTTLLQVHGGEHSQKINIILHHNVLLMISSENFAVPLYTLLT